MKAIVEQIERIPEIVVDVASRDRARHEMREAALKRSRKHKIRYSTALFQIRKARVVRYLDGGGVREQAKIALLTAVPVGAVRSILRHLESPGENRRQRRAAALLAPE